MTSPKYWSTFKFGFILTHWNDKEKRLLSLTLFLIEYANRRIFSKTKNCDFRIGLTLLCLSLHACSSSSCRDLVSRLPTRLDTKTYTVQWNIFSEILIFDCEVCFRGPRNMKFCRLLMRLSCQTGYTYCHNFHVQGALFWRSFSWTLFENLVYNYFYKMKFSNFD